jgi:hypothetical protein
MSRFKINLGLRVGRKGSSESRIIELKFVSSFMGLGKMSMGDITRVMRGKKAIKEMDGLLQLLEELRSNLQERKW